MSLLNRTLRTAENLKAADEAETRQAAKLAPRDKPAGAPDSESDLAHALRTRRMLRKPLSTTR